MAESCSSPSPARMNTTTLRDVWNGHPVELGEAWTPEAEPSCGLPALEPTSLGWELRLAIGEIFKTQVCRSAEEILTTQKSWKAAMIEKGWG